MPSKRDELLSVLVNCGAVSTEEAALIRTRVETRQSRTPWMALLELGIVEKKHADLLDTAEKGYVDLAAARDAVLAHRRTVSRAGSSPRLSPLPVPPPTPPPQPVPTPTVPAFMALPTPMPAMPPPPTSSSSTTIRPLPSPDRISAAQAIPPRDGTPMRIHSAGESFRRFIASISDDTDVAPTGSLAQSASSITPAHIRVPASPARPASDSRMEVIVPSQAAATNASLVGRRLGKYAIGTQVGEGASGAIYLAHHTGLNMPVALKVLNPVLSRQNRAFADRFLREAQVAARINHPNVVRVLDCDCIEGFDFIVMEFVDGMSVREMIEINGSFTETRALEVCVSVALGLQAALAQSIIHRDIKPGNILITKSRVVKVADLGLAKVLTAEANLEDTTPGTGLGTPHYFAPEQARDASTVDHRADIYSLGATLYHMLTGTHPFTGRTIHELVTKHATEPLVPPRERNPAISRTTSAVVETMMAKSPADRPPNYDALISLMQRAIQQLTAGPPALSQSTQIASKLMSWFQKKP